MKCWSGADGRGGWISGAASPAVLIEGDTMANTPDPYSDFVFEGDIGQITDYSLGEYEADTSHPEGPSDVSGGDRTADTLEPRATPLRVRFAAQAGEE
jgi:hypothetical protein